MALHNELGEEGEKMAVDWLKEKGYEILHLNWRYSHYEIDIIARKNSILHIIEVKCRRFFPGVCPEEKVTRKKFKYLQRATTRFLFLHPGYKWIQYDILAITVHRNKEAEYFLLQDVFL
ncbi:MAG: hypothetical protein E6Q24_03660 [Chitinophagaceae bacterium]|jgi:putative endonuclease|nr:YraN family protein [Sphingobacteriales bacterium]OJV99428.1 MAG: hypothetical protein BGO52_12255 [Sphingobacteriales bacterium 44-61]TXJ28785.1 MAG: hypothetical protein E6Q24_03660 [Chitinophagaceae bacterium]